MGCVVPEGVTASPPSHRAELGSGLGSESLPECQSPPKVGMHGRSPPSRSPDPPLRCAQHHTDGVASWLGGKMGGGEKKQMEIPRQCCVLGVFQGSPEAMRYTEDAGGVKVLPSSVWYPGTGGWSSGRGNTFCGDTPNLTPGLGVHKAGGSGERGQQCLGSAKQHLGSSLEPLLPKPAMGRG